MPDQISGGCLCGAVRYTATGEPRFAAHCHCRDCQKAHGGGHASGCLVPRESVTLTGEVKFYDSKGGSGKTISRGFCPECGSPVLAKVEIMPDIAILAAGTMDDPSAFRPTMNIFTASTQPWDQMDPDLANFPAMPDV